MSDIATAVVSRVWLGRRLMDHRDRVASVWASRTKELLADDELGAVKMEIDDLALIDELVAFLDRADNADTWAWPAALKLGERRYRDGASVHMLLREFEVFGDVVDEFIEREVSLSHVELPAVVAVKLIRTVSQGVEAAEQQAIRSFMALYSAAVEEQNTELLNLSRVVGHEIRQPLSVLRVLPQVLPVQAGDIQSTYLVDVLSRNVVRLTAVTHRLERLAQLVQRVKT